MLKNPARKPITTPRAISSSGTAQRIDEVEAPVAVMAPWMIPEKTSPTL